MTAKFDPAKHPRDHAGTPTGGRFAKMARPDAVTNLTEPCGDDPHGDTLRAELEPWGPIPDPEPGQTLKDGTPTGETFADAYVTYFRPVLEWDDTHPESDRTAHLTDEDILNLAGIGEANLGRFRGVDLTRDERTGDPVIEVYARNGSGNREHSGTGPEGPGCGCTGCTQTYTIPSLPTYIDDEDDDWDPTYVTIRFRPTSPDEADAILQLRERVIDVETRRYLHDTILAGQKAPWDVLTPASHYDPAVAGAARDTARRERDRFASATRAATEYATAHRTLTGHAWDTDLSTVRTSEGDPLSYGVILSATRWQSSLKDAARHRQTAREAADTLTAITAESAHLAGHLNRNETPTLRRLVDERVTELETALQESQTRAKDASDRGAVHQSRFETEQGQADRHAAAAHDDAQRARARTERLEWVTSWPGDPAGCPAAPGYVPGTV